MSGREREGWREGGDVPRVFGPHPEHSTLLLLLLLYSRTGPRRALSLKLSDRRVYEPEKRTRLCPQFCSYSTLRPAHALTSKVV